MAEKNRGRNLLRMGGAAALTAGLAAGGYGVASAASGGSTTTPAPGGAGTYGTPGGSGPMGHMGGRFGPRRMGFGGGAMGVVKSVDQATSSFTITDRAGNARTITTTASTTYSRDGSSAKFSDLAAGERVAVRGAGGTGTSATAPSASTPVTAADVDIVDPTIAGTVQSVSGNTLTVTDAQGFYRDVDISGATITNGGSTGSASDLTAGARVVAFGTISSDHRTLDAIKVEVNPTRPGPMGAPDGDGGFRGGPGGGPPPAGTSGPTA